MTNTQSERNEEIDVFWQALVMTLNKNNMRRFISMVALFVFATQFTLYAQQQQKNDDGNGCLLAESGAVSQTGSATAMDGKIRQLCIRQKERSL